MGLDDWRQGDVFEHCGRIWAVLTRACDIVKPADKRSTVMCAPLVQVKDPHALDGRIPQWAPVPGYQDGTWCADLHNMTSFPKTALDGLTHTPGCRTGDHERFFRRQLGRYFSKPSHPPCVEASCKAVALRLKDKYKKHTAEAALIGIVNDVRVETAPPSIGPHDNTTEREICLVFIIDNPHMPLAPDELLPPTEQTKRDRRGMSELHEIAKLWSVADNDGDRIWLLQEYFARLVEDCKPVAPVRLVTHEVVPEYDYGFDRVKASASLDVEQLSYAKDLFDDTAHSG